MANGKITLGKQSGGTLGLVFPDGVSNTEVVLPESGNITSVNTAVTDNAIARYDGTTGKLQNSGVIIDDSGNVGIGVTPSAWTTSRVLQLGLYSSIHENNATGAVFIGSNIYRISQDISNYIVSGWGATLYAQNGGAHYWYTAPSGTAGNPITWTNAMALDHSGNLLLTSGTGALGYGAGAGGTVTQLTSKSTAVTLNKPSGVITMNNSALAPGTSVYFQLNNSLIRGLDQIVYSGYYSYINPTNYRFETSFTTGGYVMIRVTNISTISLSEAVQFSFSILKGSNT